MNIQSDSEKIPMCSTRIFLDCNISHHLYYMQIIFLLRSFKLQLIWFIGAKRSSSTHCVRTTSTCCLLMPTSACEWPWCDVSQLAVLVTVALMNHFIAEHSFMPLPHIHWSKKPLLILHADFQSLPQNVLWKNWTGPLAALFIFFCIHYS